MIEGIVVFIAGGPLPPCSSILHILPSRHIHIRRIRSHRILPIHHNRSHHIHIRSHRIRSHHSHILPIHRIRSHHIHIRHIRSHHILPIHRNRSHRSHRRTCPQPGAEQVAVGQP